MRYCGILALPCAVLRYSYPPYAPLAARRLKHGSVQQRLKNGSEQLQGENGQPFEVNETHQNYDAVVHGYTCFVTNSPLVC